MKRPRGWRLDHLCNSMWFRVNRTQNTGTWFHGHAVNSRFEIVSSYLGRETHLALIVNDERWFSISANEIFSNYTGTVRQRDDIRILFLNHVDLFENNREKLERNGFLERSFRTIMNLESQFCVKIDDSVRGECSIYSVLNYDDSFDRAGEKNIVKKKRK